MNESIGKITCPLCGNVNATVHQQKNRGHKKYYRCYDGDHGTCGTIQCTGQGGQRFIEKNMRPLKGAELTEVVEDAKQAAKESAVKAAHQGQKLAEKAATEVEEKPKRKSSLLGAFFEDE